MPIVPLMIFMVVMLFVIVFVLKKLIFTDTTSAVNRLNEARSSSVKKQEELEKKINELEENQRKIIQKAKQDADNIKREAMEKVNEEKEEILQKARKESEEVAQKAFESRDKIKVDLEKEMEFKAADYSVELLKKILTEKACAQLHEQMVEDLIDSISKIPQGQVGEEITSVSLETPFEASDKILERLNIELKKVFSRTFEFKTKINKELYCGMILTFGTFAVDGSLQWQLKEIVEKMKKNLDEKI